MVPTSSLRSVPGTVTESAAALDLADDGEDLVMGLTMPKRVTRPATAKAQITTAPMSMLTKEMEASALRCIAPTASLDWATASSTILVTATATACNLGSQSRVIIAPAFTMSSGSVEARASARAGAQPLPANSSASGARRHRSGARGPEAARGPRWRAGPPP